MQETVESLDVIEKTPDNLEIETRRSLAALYRAVAMYNWDDLIFTHISARIPNADPDDHEERFLINEYGLAFNEVTASNLVTIDASGNGIESTGKAVNPAGFVIHSAVHRNRDDGQYVMHLHSRDGVAVSAQKDGFLPISQQSLMVYDKLAYHDYGGIVDDEAEQKALLADLGDKEIAVLRNHGVLIVGPSPEAVFLNAYFYQTACSIQVAASNGEYNRLPNEIMEKVRDQKKSMQGASSAVRKGASMAWDVVLRRLDALDPTYRS